MASSDYLLDLDFSITYGPMDDRLNGLYLPALSRSVRYDRTTGLFSSFALAVAARGVDALIRNRGHMRLLVGAGFEEAEPGDVGRMHAQQKVLKDRFLSLLDVAEPWMSQRLESLGWMAAEKTLEIRVAIPVRGGKYPGATAAMAHDLPRLGIFTDAEGNQLGFYGTISETADAGDQNYENLIVHKSWDSGNIYLQVIRQHFERFWDGKEPGWRCLPLPGAVMARLVEFCPRKMLARGRQNDVSAGKSKLGPDIKKIITSQFLRDIQYFPVDTKDRLHKKSGVESTASVPEAALENPESCGLPLMRLEISSPGAIVVYYHLQENQIRPLNSVEELEEVFQDLIRRDAPPVASEIKIRKHFHTLMKALEESRMKERQSVQRKEHLALVKAAQKLLVKAALCDIAKSRHATLFDEDLINASFDGATILRQRKKGPPFSELVSWINPNEAPKPVMNDPFWKEVEGKSQKRIQEIETAIAEEGRDLIHRWTELGDKNAEETVFPAITVRRYFIRDQKEKPRLALIISPPMKERFIRYLPFYSMESAYNKFARGKATAEEGWMEVGIGKKLNKSMFVMRIEDQALEPLISEGHFAVFDSDVLGPLDGAIHFVYGKDIYDQSQGGHLTIRRLKILKAGPKDEEYREISLEPLHPDYQRFQLKNMGKDAFIIIARFVCGA